MPVLEFKVGHLELDFTVNRVFLWYLETTLGK